MPSSFSPTNEVQTTYTYGRGRAFPGERPRGNIYQDRPCERCVFPQTDGSQVDSIEILTTNNGDAVSIVIDGAAIPFLAGATLTATAANAVTALDAAGTAGIFHGVIDPDGTTSALGVVTLVFADSGPHDVSFVGTVGTTATVADPPPTPGTLGVRAKAGTVACYNPTQGDPTLLKLAEPSADIIRPVGVIERGPYGSNSKPANGWGLFPGETWPEKVMVSCWQKAEVEVLIAGDVTAGGQCYFVNTGPGTPNNGYFVGSDGSDPGEGQVEELTITPAAGQDIQVHYDALPPTTIFQSVDLTTDNINLAAALNQAYGVYFAQPAAVVSGKVIVRWSVASGAHVFDDDSEAAASVASVTTTDYAAATPATAAIYPGATFVETRTADQLQTTVDLG
jgi:hypothetical protein